MMLPVFGLVSVVLNEWYFFQLMLRVYMCGNARVLSLKRTDCFVERFINLFNRKYLLILVPIYLMTSSLH